MLRLSTEKNSDNGGHDARRSRRPGDRPGAAPPAHAGKAAPRGSADMGRKETTVARARANRVKESPPVHAQDEVLGLGLYLEDLPQGRRFRTIGRTLTEADLVNFVGVTGMTEVLFTNLAFLAEESDIKRRVVPGAMVYAFAEGLLVHATMQHTGFAFLHMELSVETPCCVGDTIHVACEVIESRRSRSRPERGLVRTRNKVTRQDGSVVLTYTPLRMIKARGPA
jgi:acyl dehydratase